MFTKDDEKIESMKKIKKNIDEKEKEKTKLQEELSEISKKIGSIPSAERTPLENMQNKMIYTTNKNENASNRAEATGSEIEAAIEAEREAATEAEREPATE